jgi:hypothetical protein
MIDHPGEHQIGIHARRLQQLHSVAPRLPQYRQKNMDAQYLSVSSPLGLFSGIAKDPPHGTGKTLVQRKASCPHTIQAYRYIFQQTFLCPRIVKDPGHPSPLLRQRQQQMLASHITVPHSSAKLRRIQQHSGGFRCKTHPLASFIQAFSPCSEKNIPFFKK